jgi:hypothetical protein
MPTLCPSSFWFRIPLAGSILTLAAGLASCASAIDPDPQLNEPEPTGTVADPVRSECQPWGCGGNSADLGDGIIFHELDPNGAPNSGGVRIEQVLAPDGRVATVRVVRDHLHVLAGTTLFEGANLVGTKIMLARTVGTLTTRFELLVEQVPDANGEFQFWVGDPDPVPSYIFMYRKKGENTYAHICKGIGLEGDPMWGTGDAVRRALVFQGDRYDVRSKVITSPSSGAWFNLACAGTATAKLHLLRHTQAGSEVASLTDRTTYVTTVPQRQALLRMFVADYCGDGIVHTQDGTPLRFMETRGYPGPTSPYALDLTSPTQEIEAVWTQNGATCLKVPRLEPWSEIECVRPTCPDQREIYRTQVGWYIGSTNLGYAVSAIPH